MYRKPSKKQQIFRLAIVYSIMVVAVLILVSFITLTMLGYRFNLKDRSLEQQYALIQFGSSPSGAIVSIDGNPISSKTPNKATVKSGLHDIKIWREGYQTWIKKIDIKPGTVTWITYPLLIPEKIEVEQVQAYEQLYHSLASPDGEKILAQEDAAKPLFHLVEINSDKVKSLELALDQSIYTAATSHKFQLQSWDGGGRYVTLRHDYDDKSEWLIVDTQNTSLTKNLTRILSISVSQLDFLDTGGDRLYALVDNTIRELNLSDETISKSLVDQVNSFDYYEDSKVITFISKPDEKGNVNLGIYRSSDGRPAVIKTIPANSSSKIATSRYFNNNYIAISEGRKVVVMSGSYPSASGDEANSLKEFVSFDLDYEAKQLSFSPSGQYIIATNDSQYTVYDLEYKTLNRVNTDDDKGGRAYKFNWLDDNYIWFDGNDQLTIQEFDGQNGHIINSVIPGQAAVLTKNARYIYSFNKLEAKIQLQRVRIILP